MRGKSRRKSLTPNSSCQSTSSMMYARDRNRTKFTSTRRHSLSHTISRNRAHAGRNTTATDDVRISTGAAVLRREHGSQRHDTQAQTNTHTRARATSRLRRRRRRVAARNERAKPGCYVAVHGRDAGATRLWRDCTSTSAAHESRRPAAARAQSLRLFVFALV